MAELLHFTGFVREINYQACLTEPLTKFPLADFDINRAKAFGIIQTENGDLAYAKWISPKRTQNYPLARVYNTYTDTTPKIKILTIVPVIKDDGRDGDIDKIQYSTVSWLNLLNTYLVLGYYDQADRQKESDRQKLTHQRFNNESIRSQIQEIASSQQTALQWNQQLFAERFTDILRRALDAYWEISDRTGVKIHAYVGMDDYRSALMADFEAPQKEGVRKAPIAHPVKYQSSNPKSSNPTATFCIQDESGRVYAIAPDEILFIDDHYILQESKTSTRKALPDLLEIQDALCKLILFSNLDTLKLSDQNDRGVENQGVEFSTRLKLTGRGLKGQLLLPTSPEAIETFLTENVTAFHAQDHRTLQLLNSEAEQNTPLEIEIGGSG
jgi:hypothetical protein